jgi:hypothetical protein
MCGGGGNESTVVQTSLPDYAEPYFTGLLDRAESLTAREYTPYGEARLAPLSADTLNAYDMIRSTAETGIPYLDEAAGVSRGNIGAASGLSAFDPFQFGASSGSEYQGFDPYAFSASGAFTPEAASFYMSPYMQNVVDVQQADARRQYDISQADRDATAVQAGAFGGSRAAVVDALAQEDLTRQLGEIQATGSQEAYDAAFGAFGADREARMGVEGMSADELARVQGLSAEELARVQGIGVDEAARIQAAQAGEDMAAKQFSLEGLGFSSEEAARLAGYGEAERAADIQSAQLMEQMGSALTTYEQAGLDISFDDFLRQEGYPESQLQLMSSLLQGIPIDPSMTTTTYTPYNPLSEALGAGISALGLYQGLTV